jgi:hypothetical protein
VLDHRAQNPEYYSKNRIDYARDQRSYLDRLRKEIIVVAPRPKKNVENKSE